ncbi:cupin domain-containing protein [Paenibacillus sp. R14(2021)]|uniref:cupin domain-containing protein n=1 Tax=Paenibacillus sp. R14(2021) TaxID=2859228 RepID=UPI001C6132A5|nr:cupin domain-containing protein [Paenibacillus sp. R14(2021)]
MQRISEEEARSNGIETKHDIMKNGERKFRLNCLVDGSSYCRTEASEVGAWQNSHYHKLVSELYVVQSGWLIYIEKVVDEIKLQLLREGEIVVFKPLSHHNIYLSSNTVIHTIKYGTHLENDWFSSPELDTFTKSFDPKSLILFN